MVLRKGYTVKCSHDPAFIEKGASTCKVTQNFELDLPRNGTSGTLGGS